MNHSKKLKEKSGINERGGRGTPEDTHKNPKKSLSQSIQRANLAINKKSENNRSSYSETWQQFPQNWQSFCNSLDLIVQRNQRERERSDPDKILLPSSNLKKFEGRLNQVILLTFINIISMENKTSIK